LAVCHDPFSSFIEDTNVNERSFISSTSVTDKDTGTADAAMVEVCRKTRRCGLDTMPSWRDAFACRPDDDRDISDWVLRR